MKNITRQTTNYSLGFTLIEMMIVVAMVAIMAAIAIPSYRHYIIKSKESAAKQKIQLLATELSNWQGKALSYRGFHPKNDYVPSSGDLLVYIPESSNSTNYDYAITVLDEVKGVSLTNSAADGRGWRMIARPRSGSMVESADQFVLDSTGGQCRFIHSTSVGDNQINPCGNVSGSKPW